MQYTFTFRLESDYYKAQSTGCIKEYDMMRIEVHDEEGMMIGDYPVHSLEEYVKHVKHLHENKTSYTSYPSKHYYDISEYDDDENDLIKDWDVTIGDGLEYL